ncbi:MULTISPECIES: ABC transporter permease [Bacillaceae]|uniref:ABC transporter permease n=1 Tax=Bacillaceae TaxID=186817 RepID=UPI001FE868A2|nr:ABC transporter permease [Ectobacillus funiculus]
MGLTQSIKMAMRSIKSNKLRAFLTMLGIIIGVSSVIVLVAIGQGSSKSVTDQINSLGTNLLTVNIISTDEVKLKLDDVDQFAGLNGVSAAAPAVSGRVTVKNGKTSTQVSLTGTTEAYQTIRDLTVSQGRFVTDMDVEYRQKIVVLGATTAQTLFGASEPVGQSIKVNGTSYKVVGVLESKGSSLGQSGDSTIIMPISTAQRVTQSTSIQTVYIQATDADTLTFAQMQTNRLLANLFPDKSDSYSVVNQQDVMNTMSSVSGTMTLLLGGIASISLLVGGIGIMNIMLVSVSERTKEIGIRKAIGAKRKHILLQFLIEAVVLSAMGGLIGVGLGLLITKILAAAASMTVVYSTNVMLLAFLFSLVVGVIFGVFPANKASKLHPIQALRHG